MDRISWLDPNTAGVETSRVSSVSSLESMADSAHSKVNGSKPPLHVRSASLATPSYMKNAPISRKPVPSKASPASVENSAAMPSKLKEQAILPPPEIKGTLLLAIAASPHKNVLFYLQSMLKKSPYGQIVILGNEDRESELKQLKVDIYSLLGRLGREVKVEMDLRSDWEESAIDTVVSKAVAGGQAIHGVLCSPEYDTRQSSSDIDIMALQQQDLARPFRSSVGFLQSIAKHAIPNFRSTGHEHKQPGLFLVTSPVIQCPISTLYSAACRTLLTLLVEANSSRNITIDYAENVLLPEPEPEPEPKSLKANGGPKLPVLNITNNTADDDDYPPPDSPTKLWALYNELGAAD